MKRSILLFENSLKSKKSCETHYKNRNLFRKFIGADDLTQEPESNMTNSIFLEDYIISLKERTSPNTVPTYYFPIHAFLETNDIDLK